MADKDSWLSCEIVNQLKNGGSNPSARTSCTKTRAVACRCSSWEMRELGRAQGRAGGSMEQGRARLAGIGSPFSDPPRLSQFLASRFGCSEGGKVRWSLRCKTRVRLFQVPSRRRRQIERQLNGLMAWWC